jgi:VIT1/CCC1 family predicted Fe2+/Mn2+ transporter
MNIVLWIIQGIVAIKLLDTSVSHGLRQKKPEMQNAIRKMGNSTPVLLRFTSVLTLLGAVGLILPGLLRMPGVITVICAGMVAIIFLLSLICHIRSREKPKIFVSMILFILTAIIVYGRWVHVP